MKRADRKQKEAEEAEVGSEGPTLERKVYGTEELCNGVLDCARGTVKDFKEYLRELAADPFFGPDPPICGFEQVEVALIYLIKNARQVSEVCKAADEMFELAMQANHDLRESRHLPRPDYEALAL